MKSTITFFPVDNGDMTLIKLNDNTTNTPYCSEAQKR